MTWYTEVGGLLLEWYFCCSFHLILHYMWGSSVVLGGISYGSLIVLYSPHLYLTIYCTLGGYRVAGGAPWIPPPPPHVGEGAFKGYTEKPGLAGNT
jgi:hypothetical protein